MNSYFYSDGVNSFGPFSLEQLQEKSINRDTLIWYQELGDWKKAETLPELEGYFKTVPPPLSKATTPPAYNARANNDSSNKMPPKTWLLESVLATVLCCLPFGIVGIVYASRVETYFYKGEYLAALEASDNAKTWTLISICLGVIMVVGFSMVSFLKMFH